MAKDFNDGVCEACGNTGLAGEKCIVCGGILSKVDANPDDPITNADDGLPRKSDEPESYPLDLVSSAENALDDEELADEKL
jgi:hypothetical protein